MDVPSFIITPAIVISPSFLLAAQSARFGITTRTTDGTFSAVTLILVWTIELIQFQTRGPVLGGSQIAETTRNGSGIRIQLTFTR